VYNFSQVVGFQFWTCASSSRLIALDIYRSEATRRRECLYYLALGHYKMGNYDEAKSFNCERPIFCVLVPSLGTDKPGPITARLLEREPTNLQAQSLNLLIDQAVKRGMSPNFPLPTDRLTAAYRGIYWHGHRRRCCSSGHTPPCRFGPSCRTQVMHS
jgi:Fis1 C-terminal tetratricopeptide repeat